MTIGGKRGTLASLPPSFGRRCPGGAEVGFRSGMKGNVREVVFSYFGLYRPHRVIILLRSMALLIPEIAAARCHCDDNEENDHPFLLHIFPPYGFINVEETLHFAKTFSPNNVIISQERRVRKNKGK
jgi:hypothetical protein